MPENNKFKAHDTKFKTMKCKKAQCWDSKAKSHKVCDFGNEKQDTNQADSHGSRKYTLYFIVALICSSLIRIGFKVSGMQDFTHPGGPKQECYHKEKYIEKRKKLQEPISIHNQAYYK